MANHDDLIKRLRLTGDTLFLPVCHEAAERIELLERRDTQWRDGAGRMVKRIAALEQQLRLNDWS